MAEATVAESTPQPAAPTRRRSAKQNPASRIDPQPTATTTARDATADRSALESLTLLREAEQRLRTNPRRALELLSLHAKRFADSPLALERAALRVMALCGADRIDDGRRERDAFLRAHGGSAYAERVRRSCAEPK
jgi:capsid protein